MVKQNKKHQAPQKPTCKTTLCSFKPLLRGAFSISKSGATTLIYPGLLKFLPGVLGISCCQTGQTAVYYGIITAAFAIIAIIVI